MNATSFAAPQLLRAQVLCGAHEGIEQLRMAGLARDSRSVEAGELFVAIADDEASRAAHVTEAVARGARMVLSEAPLSDLPVGAFTVPHARWSHARASAAQHDLDRRRPPLVGITGTDGKTTTASCVWHCLGAGAARVGTLGYHDGRDSAPCEQTTPPPEQLHAFLAGLADDCAGVACELSSHAVHQHRCAGLRFDVLIVTGIASDHLDYHGSQAAYVASKLQSTRLLQPDGVCICNADDPRASGVAHGAHSVGARVVTLGQRGGDARLRRGDDGWRLHHRGAECRLPMPLPGAYNAWNAAAGALAADALGVPLTEACARLASLAPVPGRLELLARAPLSYVDYAHTAGALERVLGVLRAEHPARKLVCVVGCGGDRDREKRPRMGAAALAADQVVLSNDNPRGEDPAAIAGDVLAGIDADVAWVGDDDARDARVLVELDRAAAIRLARELAGPSGVVVVCGKGHESDQIIAGKSLPWSDREFLRSLDAEAP